jgi:hypothetical protein
VLPHFQPMQQQLHLWNLPLMSLALNHRQIHQRLQNLTLLRLALCFDTTKRPQKPQQCLQQRRLNKPILKP